MEATADKAYHVTRRAKDTDLLLNTEGFWVDDQKTLVAQIIFKFRFPANDIAIVISAEFRPG